jgi:ubiquinone/menaquinone biosynthesis C-methylase UbiE
MMSFTTLKDLHDFASSYWYVCVLHSAIKLRIFTHLDGMRLPAGEVAQRIAADERATGLLLDALSSLGLLVKEQGRYANAPLSQQYLNENSADFSGHIVYHHIDMYHDWGRLDEAVRIGGPPRGLAARTEASTRHFLLGMRDLAVRGAHVLVQQLDLGDAESLLDLGGGPGTYSLHFCQRHPQLHVTVFDYPSSEILAWEQIKSFGLESRFRFVGGDFLRDPLPSGPFDVVFMSQILHSNDHDECASLMKRVYPLVRPGGRVVIQEFVLNECATSPPFAAVFSLNMLLHTPGGRSYALAEIKGWLEDAGFVNISQQFLDLPNDASLVVANRPPTSSG